MKKKTSLLVLGLSIFGFLLQPSLAYAGSNGQNISLLLRGAAKTIGAPLQIPANMMADSARVMFPFGLVTGAIKGTVKATTGLVSGAIDLARGGAPYAKYAALAL